MPNHNSPPDSDLPPELELALVFLEKARQDLVAVEKWLADEDISDEIIGFHIQQAVEKSFKATLLHQAVDFPHTHNLNRLIDLCKDSGIQIPPEFQAVDEFNRFAVTIQALVPKLRFGDAISSETPFPSRPKQSFSGNFVPKLCLGTSSGEAE